MLCHKKNITLYNKPLHSMPWPDVLSLILFQLVNTEVCEQLFSWLSKFSPITKHMNRWRFLFLMLYVLDNHNDDIQSKKNINKY